MPGDLTKRAMFAYRIPLKYTDELGVLACLRDWKSIWCFLDDIATHIPIPKGVDRTTLSEVIELIAESNVCRMGEPRNSLRWPSEAVAGLRDAGVEIAFFINQRDAMLLLASLNVHFDGLVSAMEWYAGESVEAAEWVCVEFVDYLVKSVVAGPECVLVVVCDVPVEL